MNIITEKIFNGRNIFLTGPGGCGKSYLIKEIYQYYKKLGKDIALTSTTGISAIQIEGYTLHRYSGLGIAKEKKEELLEKALKNKRLIKRWKNIEILIIDEISMMDISFFIKLNFVIKGIRNSDLPFGGIILIMSGDFYQLQPVKSYSGKKYIFELKLWKELNTYNIILEKSYRQSDLIFFNCLNNIRKGKPTIDDLNLLSSRVNITLDREPVKIFSTNYDVNLYNKQKYDQLIGQEYIYKMKFKYNRFQNLSIKLLQDLKSNLYVSECSYFKINTEVLLIANLPDHGLSNGSKGKIIGFQDNYPIVDFSDIITIIKEYTWTLEFENIKVSVTQLPLIYGWATTFHKCQGMTVDYIEMSLSDNIFLPSMAYVGLSRVKNIQGLNLLDFKPSSIYSDEKVSNFYNNIY
jgi:ATP-dependent exoDNAse (exonuclease V) alpha subunit